MAIIDWPSTIFILVVHCNYVAVLYRFRETATYWPEIVKFYTAFVRSDIVRIS